MDSDALFQRYQELQTYVGWTEADCQRVAALSPILDSCLPELIHDFYQEIDRHNNTRKVITGGQAQIERLKGTLLVWLQELLCGRYDNEYVLRRWRVGWRHVEIGLDQVYTNVALSRLRKGLLIHLHQKWTGSHEELDRTIRSLNTLMDLDLAIIEDAYQAEYLARQQRVERLAAIGQVAGGVAHELRNPLNVVKTSIYFLLNARNLTPEKRNEHMQRIERHVTLADGVITALSNFARMPVPARVGFSVIDCIKQSLEANPVGDKIVVSFDFPDSFPKALADKDQIGIVFANLIRNAREAMLNGGTLGFSGRVEDSRVIVNVADTGTGIAPESLARVMEPLYSTKARGLGLGLAITRSILEKNLGSLRVESEVGKGSVFVVTLQIAPALGQPEGE